MSSNLSDANNDFSVLHLNTMSLKPHFEKLEALILSLESPPDIICLSETWLNDNDNSKGYLVNGYYDFLVKNQNRTNVRGGGVMIQVKENVKILRQLETPFEESIFAEVEKNFFRLKIGVVYNHLEQTNCSSLISLKISWKRIIQHRKRSSYVEGEKLEKKTLKIVLK